MLGRWAVEKLGGFDHQFYTNLFELKLRMKGIICGQPGGRQVLTAIILSILILQMNINELYYSVGKNKMYASPGRASTNDLAAYAKVIFDLDSADSHYYNHEWANGKWNHMMDQTHIS